MTISEESLINEARGMVRLGLNKMIEQMLRNSSCNIHLQNHMANLGRVPPWSAGREIFNGKSLISNSDDIGNRKATT